MPWKCEVCTLINAEDDGNICDLCGESKGTPDPDKGKKFEERHLSLRSMLRAGPEAFKGEMKEVRRMAALKEIKGVFGIPLNTSTPRVLCDCMAFIRAHGMRTQGIFRIPGQQDIVDTMRDMYEKKESSDVLNHIKCGVNDVATLFKYYFRQLPDALISGKYYGLFLGAVRNNKASKDAMIQALFDVVFSMPSPNRECLGMLIYFLRDVTMFSEVNKMTPANLATCFAPSLMRAPDGSSPESVLMDMSTTIAALNILIKDNIEIPTPTLEKIRRNTVYKAKKQKAPAVPPRGPPGLKDKGGAPPGMKSKAHPPTLPARGGDKVKPPPGMGFSRKSN